MLRFKIVSHNEIQEVIQKEPITFDMPKNPSELRAELKKIAKEISTTFKTWAKKTDMPKDQKIEVIKNLFNKYEYLLLGVQQACLKTTKVSKNVVNALRILDVFTVQMSDDSKKYAKGIEDLMRQAIREAFIATDILIVDNDDQNIARFAENKETNPYLLAAKDALAQYFQMRVAYLQGKSAVKKLIDEKMRTELSYLNIDFGSPMNSGRSGKNEVQVIRSGESRIIIIPKAWS